MAGKNRKKNPLANRINKKVDLALVIVKAEAKRFAKLKNRAGNQTKVIEKALEQATDVVEKLEALKKTTDKLPSDFSAEKRVGAKKIVAGCKIIIKSERRQQYVGMLDDVLINKPLTVLRVGTGPRPVLLIDTPKGGFVIRRPEVQLVESEADAA
jgi:hypothetical protein